MTANPLEKTEECNGRWKFDLLELAGSHYAAVCTEDDQADEGAFSVDTEGSIGFSGLFITSFSFLQELL